MKTIKYILIIFILSHTSCTGISQEKIVSGTKIQANINISDDPETQVLDHISIKLFDKKEKPISNENIIVTVNDKALISMGQAGNYYNHTYWHEIDDVPSDSIYIFKILLQDSTVYELAAFFPFKKITKQNISITKNEESHDIKWKNLGDFNTLEIKKYTTESSYIPDSIIKKKINTKEGQFTINPDFFKGNANHTTKSIGIEFISEKGGLLSTELLENSTIKGYSSFSINTKDILYKKR